MVVRLRQPNLKMSSTLSAADWESMYAPYDQPTYQSVLEVLKPEDVVLDIGAGDLRFARQAAWLVEKVYAVESNAQVLYQAQASLERLPDHLIPVCTDAQALDFPTDITVGVLLM